MLIRCVFVVVLAVSVAPVAALNTGGDQAPGVAAGRQLPKPNYDLASRWTSAKVGKYVFSTAVTPHWLEFSERFWYEYETPDGKNWWMVDPVKKTKTPLWDNAKMASQLTRILRTPYDAQHLPIGTIRFIDNDTKIRFSVTLPRDSRVENAAGQELTGETQTEQNQLQGGGGRGRGGRGGDQQQQEQGGRGAGGQAAPQTRQWWLEYELATGNLVLNDKYEAPKPDPTWAQVSPDKQTILFARGHNLFMMDAKNYEAAKKKADDPAIQETQLTTDGDRFYGYAANSQGGQEQEQQQDQTQTTTQGGGAATTTETEMDKKFGPRTRSVGASWSQDHKKFSVQRSDNRKVGDLWVINALANPRPRLETYKYGMPGEENQTQVELQVFDIAAKKGQKISTDAFKDQQMGIATAPVTNLQREKQETAARWLGPDSNKIYFNRTSRDLKRIDIVEADTVTGEPRVAVAERSNTYIEIQPLRLLNNGAQGIHWSERDGWGHYYLMDMKSGKVLKQITSGEFVGTGVVSIDEKARALYFSAAGRERGEDPYFQHFYRANIDTGEIKLLNPGNASHSVSMNDKSTFFIDTFSRVDTAPESVLYDAAGTKVMDLEKTDVSALIEAGFKYPEAFAVKADDGITDLYGTMYKPFDFDPSKKYPIILFVYPGPQTESVTKTFTPRQANVAIANAGFIVVEVGNRGGSPQRSKWYHNYGYGNLRDYGISDKKAAVEQLAKRHAWIDTERVGIYGHSGGGFMTAAAMFSYPDFFKVGVSSAGNHDNAIYNRWWSEKHDGVKEVVKDDKVTFEYDIDKNQDIAKNLKGKLLLMHGDMDNNVHPSGTLRVADALIRANKRFDFMILPGQRHGYGPMNDYVFWRRLDYFAQHLLGAAPTDVDIVELTREQQIRK
jgi:dipeptidyl aminopeptidase/acylaminoacyl peptidase